MSSPLQGAAAPLQTPDGVGLTTIARRPLACQIGGLLLLAYAALNACIWKKFTPVYTATECGDQRAVLDELTLGASSIEMGMQIEVTCTNPNPYGIKILTSTPGRVFVKLRDTRMQIGDLKVKPGSKMKEQGSGVIRVRMDAKLTGEQADLLLPHFLEDTAVPVLMELKFNVGISLSFGIGGSWGTAAPFEKACGLNMAGLLVNQFLPTDGSAPTRLGPLVCRNSFHNMYIPPVGEASETPSDGHMGFSAAQVAPQEVAAGEFSKNASLGVVISLCLFGGFGLLFGFPAGPTERLAAMLAALVGGRTLPPQLQAGHHRPRRGVEVAPEEGTEADETVGRGGSPTKFSPTACWSAMPSLMSALARQDPCSPGMCTGKPGGRGVQTPPAAGSRGAHGRSPRALASGTAAWPSSWVEELQRAVTRSFSPVRVAAARYFPASMVSPRSGDNTREGSGLGFSGSEQQAAPPQASAGGAPSSPLDAARRQLFSLPSPGGSKARADSRAASPSVLEEAKGSRSREREAQQSRQNSRWSARDEVSPRQWSKDSPRGRTTQSPRSAQKWPQAWSPSRDSWFSMNSRGLPRAAADAGSVADAAGSRGLADAEGSSTATPRLPPRPPAAQTPSAQLSARSSAPYGGPASSMKE